VLKLTRLFGQRPEGRQRHSEIMANHDRLLREK